MASIMKRGNTYSVRYNYKDHAGKPCKGWETFKTKAEAQERRSARSRWRRNCWTAPSSCPMQ